MGKPWVYCKHCGERMGQPLRVLGHLDGAGEPLQVRAKGWGSPWGYWERKWGAQGALCSLPLAHEHLPWKDGQPQEPWREHPQCHPVPPASQSITTFGVDCHRCRWVPTVAFAAPCTSPEDPPAGVPGGLGGPCGNKGVCGRGWEVLGVWVKGVSWLEPALTFPGASWHLQRKTGGVTLETQGPPSTLGNAEPAPDTQFSPGPPSIPDPPHLHQHPEPPEP